MGNAIARNKICGTHHRKSKNIFNKQEVSPEIFYEGVKEHAAEHNDEQTDRSFLLT